VISVQFLKRRFENAKNSPSLILNRYVWFSGYFSCTIQKSEFEF
jgi:hypothetical protein